MTTSVPNRLEEPVHQMVHAAGFLSHGRCHVLDVIQDGVDAGDRGGNLPVLDALDDLHHATIDEERAEEYANNPSPLPTG